ncbi:MAG: 30S ribosomal protein S18 [Candidatus Brocadiales bacterium]
MARERNRVQKRKYVYAKKCRFCRMKMEEVNYKDLANIRKLVATQGKLLSRKRTGNCAMHQRSTKSAVKRARFMALLPYAD